MNTNVFMENAGGVVRDSLVIEAKRFAVSHQPPLTLEDWKSRRAELVSLIKANAGTFCDDCDLDVKYYASIQMPGYSVKKLTYQSRPGFRVTANLYVPDGPGPFPGVLNLHGHWAQGKIAERVQNRGHLLALNGFVVLAVDAFGAGERGTVPGEFEYHGAGIGGSLFTVGETLLGMQVNDNMRGIDLLQSLDYVDAERIGVTGASGGVGLFACQLAKLMGAHVVGLIRREQYADMVRSHGADDVVVSEDGGAACDFGPYRLIAESVGGDVLTNAIKLLGPDGICVSFGASAGVDAALDVRSFYGAARVSVYGFLLFNELGREPAGVGLARLAELLSQGRIKTFITAEDSWENVGKVALDLWDRKIPGKAVLRIE